MAKKQLNKTEDLIHFSSAIKAGTKNENVRKEINKLCDQLITDAITHTVLKLNNEPERLKFKNEFLNWSKIESCLDKTATENIKEINTNKVKVKEHLIKFKTKPDFKELGTIEGIAENLTKNKLNRFLNEDRLNLFIKEQNTELKELEESKNLKIQERRAAIGLVNSVNAQANTTKSNSKQLTLKEWALYYVYVGVHITKDNQNEKLKGTGHNSGPKLKQNYDFYNKTSNRINADTGRKNNHRLKEFENVIGMLKKENEASALERAESEYKTFKAKIE
jgi:hypothetical protein